MHFMVLRLSVLTFHFFSIQEFFFAENKEAEVNMDENLGGINVNFTNSLVLFH